MVDLGRRESLGSIDVCVSVCKVCTWSVLPDLGHVGSDAGVFPLVVGHQGYQHDVMRGQEGERVTR